MRRVSAVVAGVTVLTFVTAVAVAATRDGQGQTDQRIDRQATLWTTSPRHAPDGWLPISWTFVAGSKAQVGPEPITVHAAGTVSVTFSASFTGGPVELRARDGSHVMRPGQARFDPSARSQSFSFTFVRHGGHPACGRHISVQWRRVGKPVTLHRADLVVTYKKDITDHHGVGCA
jgi:hypothetical protein